MAAVLPLGADDLGARGRGEVGELGERVLGGPALVVPGVDGDEERLLDGRGQFDHVGHPAGGYRGRSLTGSGGGGRAADNRSVDFTLRPMEPADGPALDTLLTTQATATAVAMSTRYRYDVFASLIAQHPSLYGVVATAPGVEGLVGMATAYIDEVQVEDRLFPCAHLENLKVRDDVRRQGLGRQARRVAHRRGAAPVR